MTKYKKIEMLGSILMALGFVCQFFLLTPMAEDKRLSFTIDIMENQARIYTAIYEGALAENVGQEIDTTRLAENGPTYYDEAISRLHTLDRQSSFLSYVFGTFFVVGSALTIFARYRET
ncbi:hypothetical protein [Loktanella sp. R86503]|uniref:hypothetical protein n=1 Tax=Loktanella sp. R86503 TaxID=3093847 RepID=UPI0036DE2823